MEEEEEKVELLVVVKDNFLFYLTKLKREMSPMIKSPSSASERKSDGME